MQNVDLTIAERDALAQALQSAFYNQSELEQLVYFSLGEQFDDVAAPGPVPARVMALIQWAEARGRTDELISKAYERRPGNPKLAAFWARYTGSVQRQVTRDALERITDSAVQLKNAVVWRERMARAESCVCRVIVGGIVTGTGVLAGAGLVITNYHVVEKRGDAPLQVELGHRVNSQGVLENGKLYDVVGAPVFERPYSAVDRVYPKASLPAADELDVAVLEVAGSPETAIVDGKARGTIAPAASPRLSAGDLISILQHPKGEHLQFAYDRVLAINANETRVTYKVNTRPGSSGSPCFDADWNLIAIHHSGDPRTSVEVAEYNEGIPIATISRALPAALRTRLGWPG